MRLWDISYSNHNSLEVVCPSGIHDVLSVMVGDGMAPLRGLAWWKVLGSLGSVLKKDQRPGASSLYLLTRKAGFRMIVVQSQPRVGGICKTLSQPKKLSVVACTCHPSNVGKYKIGRY
jgi:hypothetical protein